MQNPATKVFSERARESALAVRRHQAALGASDKPGGTGAVPSGTITPAIAARVKELLAAKQGKGKKGGKGKAKAAAKPKVSTADKAKAKADRLAKQTAAKQDREKAKIARDMDRTAKQAARETTRKQKVAERTASAAKKQQEHQAKLKQAAQAKKKAASEKAKAAGAKPAAKPAHADPAKKQADNRAKVAKEMADQDAGLSPGGSAALSSFADGKPLKEETAKQFEEMGLTEKGSGGAPRLTTEGHAAAAAMSKGDTRGALDAISRAADKKKAKPAGKAMDMSDIDLAIKAGARHSKMDASHLDEAARHLHAAGATCPDCAPDEEGDGDEAATKAIKGIMDDPGYFAQHECGDVMQACSGLQTLAMLIQSELSEDDPDPADINQLTDAARILVKFIESELDEMESAAEEDVKEDANEPVPMAKAVGDDFFAVKSIGDSDDVSGPAVRFGSSDEPDLSETHDFFTKSTNYWLDSWDKRPMLWHHTMPQVEILQTMRAAGAAPDEIKAMREAIVYLEDNPVIGVWTKATIDPVAVWMNGQLDRAHRYRSAIKRMIDLGMLKISTDSAPHLVRREKQMNGTHEVKRWPIVAASLTPSAAEPRLFDVKAIQSWYDVAGITLPFAIDEEPEAINPESARRDGVKADDERARRILLELDILQLEETAL